MAEDNDRDAASNQLVDYKSSLQDHPGSITTSTGMPIGVMDAVLTVGNRGPMLAQDNVYFDDVRHLTRERIPERVVHAKGAGAFGFFEVTHNITKYCVAKLFERVRKRTPVAVRFSLMTSETGSADTVRDMRGFAVKFFTEDGAWDLVCSSLPVFPIRDPLLFPSFTHSQRRNPQTHLKDVDMFWDFITLRPETTHYAMMLFSERGIPDGYRYMHGYGINTFRFINNKGEHCYARITLKTNQCIRTMDEAMAIDVAKNDYDYASRDLFNSIKNNSFPCWTFYIQVLTQEQLNESDFNYFDPTKIWPHFEHPMIEVGKLVLDRNPTNYFAEIEQMAFNPGNMVPGIEPSYDKVLQARLFAYGDAQRYRLGSNYSQIPVNCPFRVPVKNYQRDGLMTVTDNQGGAPNYYPNSFLGPDESIRAKCLQSHIEVSGEIYRHRSCDEDNFSQATNFWVNVLDEDSRKHLVESIASHLSKTCEFIQERALKNFSLVHADFGRMLTDALNLAACSPVRIFGN